jgi:hypothetical protein
LSPGVVAPAPLELKLVREVVAQDKFMTKLYF